MFKQVLHRLPSYFKALRPELNAQFLTVFVGYFLLSVVSFTLLELSNYPDQPTLKFAAKMVMRSAQQAGFIVFLFGLFPMVGRKLHLILICFLFPSLIINIGHFVLYESLIHPGALGAAFFATVLEMSGYVRTFGPDVALALAPTLLIFPIYWRFRFDRIGPHARRMALVIFIAMLSVQTISSAVTASRSDNFLEKFASHMKRRAYECTFLFGNDATGIYTFGSEYYKFRKAREHMKDAAFDATVEEGAPELAVIVIGESLTRSHLPFYGYERNTMPKLAKWHETGDLLVFEDVIAVTNLTRLVLLRALTLATHDDREPFYRGDSIVAAARSAGYDTYWISNAGMLTPHDTEHTALARQADETQMVNTDFRLKSLDGKLLPVFEKFLERPSKRKLIVLHTLGSHPKYDQRYSEEFAYYDDAELPEGVPELNERETRHFNQYDNTIRYTDDFLNTVLTRVREQDANAMFLYFADHGQDMFEPPDERMGHAHPKPSKYELEVPMFAWFSESYKAENPDAWRYLKDARSAPLSTAYLFDTVVDMLRIESDDWAGDKSLVQPDPPVYDRHVISPDENRVFIYEPDRMLYE
ncbi:MAG: phosphoethanolamine transferase [Persicimonas sp.]